MCGEEMEESAEGHRSDLQAVQRRTGQLKEYGADGVFCRLANGDAL